MATFVLVHGGGHGGWCYQLVARRLRAEGHDLMLTEPERVTSALAERAHHPALAGGGA